MKEELIIGVIEAVLWIIVIAANIMYKDEKKE